MGTEYYRGTKFKVALNSFLQVRWFVVYFEFDPSRLESSTTNTLTVNTTREMNYHPMQSIQSCL